MSNLPSLEYLAGLFDSTGTLGIYKSSDHQKPVLSFRLGRDAPDIPTLFAQRFGGRVRIQKRSNGARYIWTVRGRRAQDVMRQLLPFVRIKRIDVERYCALQINRPGGLRSPKTNPTSIGNEMQRMCA